MTNFGYKKLTINFIESLKKINLEKDLIVYTTCDKTLNHFKKYYPEINSVLLESNITNNKIIYGKKNWKEINFLKFKAILIHLEKGEDVLYSDGDIVFIRNPFEYLKQNLGENELLIQNDNKNILCCGFYYIKSNKNTIKFLKPANLDNYEHDQDYFNKNKDKIKYKLLPLDLFPNGRYFAKNKYKLLQIKDLNNYSICSKINNKFPFLIHFNWTLFDFKFKLMNRYNFNYYYERKNTKLKIYVNNRSNLISPELFLLNYNYDNYKDFIHKIFFPKNILNYNKDYNTYQFIKNNFIISNDIKNCDCILYPHIFNGVKEKQFKILNKLSIKHNKKIIFFSSKYIENYFDNYLIEYFQIPKFVPDYFCENYIRNDMLSISFFDNSKYKNNIYIKQIFKHNFKREFLFFNTFNMENNMFDLKKLINNINKSVFHLCFIDSNFYQKIYYILMMGRIPIIMNLDYTDINLTNILDEDLNDYCIIIYPNMIKDNNITNYLLKYINNVKNKVILQRMKNCRKLWEKNFSLMSYSNKIYNLIIE